MSIIATHTRSPTDCILEIKNKLQSVVDVVSGVFGRHQGLP